MESCNAAQFELRPQYNYYHFFHCLFVVFECYHALASNQRLSLLVSVMNWSFSPQVEKQMLHLQNKPTHDHKAKTGFSSRCEKSQAFICSRRKHSKLQQTIMKGHCTQSGIAFSSASSSTSSFCTFSSSVQFHSLVPFYQNSININYYIFIR